METARTPKFCGRCGTPLQVSSTNQGFDPFTGEPKADITLVCPNPDKTHTAKLLSREVDTQITYHPSWHQNTAGIWTEQG